MIRELEDELRTYDELKSDELTLPHVERLYGIAPFVAKNENRQTVAIAEFKEILEPSASRR